MKTNDKKQLSIKVLRFPIRREKYLRCNLSSGQFYLGGGTFLGANCPRGNYTGEKSSERQFSSGAIVLRAIVWWSKCPGGDNPGGNHPEGNCPGG